MIDLFLLGFFIVSAHAEVPSLTPPVSHPDESTSTLRMETLSIARDPFRSPEFKGGVASESAEDLEQYSLDVLKVIGILTGADHLRALIATPDGRTFSVGRGSRIGAVGGVVKQIYDDRVVIQEKAKNLAGKVESRLTDLPLIPEDANPEQENGKTNARGGG